MYLSMGKLSNVMGSLRKPFVFRVNFCEGYYLNQIFPKKRKTTNIMFILCGRVMAITYLCLKLLCKIQQDMLVNSNKNQGCK